MEAMCRVFHGWAASKFFFGACANSDAAFTVTAFALSRVARLAGKQRMRTAHALLLCDDVVETHALTFEIEAALETPSLRLPTPRDWAARKAAHPTGNAQAGRLAATHPRHDAVLPLAVSGAPVPGAVDGLSAGRGQRWAQELLRRSVAR
jgi:hypothetical protein